MLLPLYISQIVRKENLKPDIDEDDQERDIESCERNGKLALSKNCKEPVEIVSDTCAICLDSYEPGDIIVWSTNLDCHHIFHEDCIAIFLAMTKSKERPCPCCRQCFCDMPQQATEKIEKKSTKKAKPRVFAFAEDEEAKTRQNSIIIINSLAHST